MLDNHLSVAKHVIRKYKDLVIKLQLQMNAQVTKMEQLRTDKQKYKDKCREYLAIAPQQEVQPYKTASLTPEKLTSLLEEVQSVQNQVDRTMNNKSMSMD